MSKTESHSPKAETYRSERLFTKDDYRGALRIEQSRKARDRMPIWEAYLELGIKVAPETA
jgi:hypothetical protein